MGIKTLVYRIQKIDIGYLVLLGLLGTILAFYAVLLCLAGMPLKVVPLPIAGACVYAFSIMFPFWYRVKWAPYTFVISILGVAQTIVTVLAPVSYYCKM